MDGLSLDGMVLSLVRLGARVAISGDIVVGSIPLTVAFHRHAFVVMALTGD